MFTSISKIIDLFNKSDINIEKNQKKILGFTVNASIAIQIITGLITLGAVFFKLAPKDMILHDIVVMETIVQFIELAFYIIISYYLIKISVTGVTPLRYFDWIFTTPTMLLSTIMFFDYKNRENTKEDKNTKQDKNTQEKKTGQEEKTDQEKKTGQEEKPGETGNIRFLDFVKKNKEIIIKIVISNCLMLLSGYLGEIGKINLYLANIVGFLFFGFTFYTIWNNYVRKSTVAVNHQLFYFMFVIWAFYGVAALASPLVKNIGYNFLDIVAKNFYGLFIFYQMYLTRIQ